MIYFYVAQPRMSQALLNLTFSTEGLFFGKKYMVVIS